jgi:hypothetical protein
MKVIGIDQEDDLYGIILNTDFRIT